MQRSEYIVLGVSVTLLMGVIGFSHVHRAAATASAVAQGASAAEALHTATTTPASVATSTNAAPVRVPILIYHDIRPDYPGETAAVKAFTLTPDELDAQLSYLSDHGYTAISLDDLAHDIQTGTTSPIAKPVVLTFDDGWQNEYVYAFPLLQKYHFTATFFIFTNPVSKKDTFMTWDEIIHLSVAGMTIGDHTLSHPLLSKLTPEQLRKEVVDSKSVLEQKIGKPVTDFASPFGYTSEALVTLLKQVGYITGRTTTKGIMHSAADQYALTGYLVHRDLKDFIYILTLAH